MIEAFNSAIDSDHALAFVMNCVRDGQEKRKDREFSRNLDALSARLGV